MSVPSSLPSLVSPVTYDMQNFYSRQDLQLAKFYAIIGVGCAL